MIDTVALREKVLDLAIRGKLVPQDPNDEPASVLLERIRTQKQQMVKDGKLKEKDIKDDSIIFVGEDNLHYEKFADGTVKCIEDEIPFELPEGWAWCRLSQIITLYSGQDLEPSRYNDEGIGIPYITGASNLENGKVIINRWTDSPTTRATIGDLLITCKGSGVGKMAWCSICDAHIARQIMALRCIDGLYSDYLEVVISAMLTNIKSKANGLIPGLSRDIILGIMFPLPPFEEQKLICIKCREVLSYIDNIDNQKTDLVETIDIIKSRILDLAIRGKLVPQNPDDEPASVLLERIRAEKEELIRQGKIKRDKKESVIFKGEDNSYYENLPSSWARTTLGTISQLVTKGTTPRGGNVAYTESGIGFLRAENVKGFDQLSLENLKYVDEDTHNDFLKRSILQSGDILITIAGTLGRTAVVTHDVLPLNTNQAIAIVRPINIAHINIKYIVYALNAEHISKALLHQEVAMAIPNLSLENISDCSIPLPPLEEQNRIVKFIEKAFNLIDSIEL